MTYKYNIVVKIYQSVEYEVRCADVNAKFPRLYYVRSMGRIKAVAESFELLPRTETILRSRGIY